MIYGENYTVKWHDTDACGEVRPARILEYMQETSNLQFRAIGHPLNRMHDEQHMGFILSRIAICFDRPIHAYEQIRTETFATNGHGISFGRCFRILAGGETAARAYSVWALVRTDTHEMVKVSDCPVTLEEEPADEQPFPLRFRIPSDLALEEVGIRTVRYSDLDFNSHMNNTRYPDVLCDFLPDLTAYRVRGMSLSFLHEAAAGETLRVLRAADPTDESKFWFRTVREDGQVNIEAMVLVAPRD